MGFGKLAFLFCFLCLVAFVTCQNTKSKDEDYVYVTSANMTTLCCPLKNQIIYNISMRSKNENYGCYGMQHTALTDMLKCYMESNCTINFNKHVAITSTVNEENDDCIMMIPDILMYNFYCINKDQLFILDEPGKVIIYVDEGVLFSHDYYPWHYHNPKIKGSQITSVQLLKPKEFKFLWMEFVNLDIAETDNITVNGKTWLGGINIADDNQVDVQFTVKAGNKFSGFVISFKWLKKNSTDEFKSRPYPQRKNSRSTAGMKPINTKNLNNLSPCTENELKGKSCNITAGHSLPVESSCSSKPEKTPNSCLMKVKSKRIMGKIRYTKGLEFDLKLRKSKRHKVFWLGLKHSDGTYRFNGKSYPLRSSALSEIKLQKKKLTVTVTLHSKMVKGDFLCYNWGEKPKSLSCSGDVFAGMKTKVNKCRKRK